MPINKNKKQRVYLANGFGLVELLVSVSIMILVMGVVLSRNSAFNGASLLRAQAFDLALVLQEMQSLAISATNDESGDNYRNVYGLVFDKSDSKANSYIIFRDADADFSYDADEIFGKQGIIDNRYKIDDIKFLDSSGAYSQNKVTILFKRPNFDALFYDSGSPVDSAVYGVQIVIRRKGTTGDGVDKVRIVEVSRTGQITVK